MRCRLDSIRLVQQLTNSDLRLPGIIFPFGDCVRHPIVERYQRFIADNGIGIAGIEFITDRAGAIYTYDVNTNTNYNSDAEAVAGIFGMRAIAGYLGDELHHLEGAGLSALVAA